MVKGESSNRVRLVIVESCDQSIIGDHMRSRFGQTNPLIAEGSGSSPGMVNVIKELCVIYYGSGYLGFGPRVVYLFILPITQV